MSGGGANYCTMVIFLLFPCSPKIFHHDGKDGGSDNGDGNKGDNRY